MHDFIERTPDSFRYRVTDLGWRVALSFTRAYNRLLRPELAAALPTLRAVATPLSYAFMTLTTKIDAMITQAQLVNKLDTFMPSAVCQAALEEDRANG